MAIQATTQTIYDGETNVTIKCIGVSDGGIEDPQEDGVVKVPVNTLVPVGGKVKIMEIQYDVSWGVVALFWDAVPPVPIAYLDGSGKFDFSASGGMQNGGDEETATGDILLSTAGFEEANSTYSILIKMKKKRR